MQKIKTFVLANCPHCSKDFYVKLEESPIEVKKIYTPVEMMTIKEDLKNKIKGIKIDSTEEKNICFSLDDEENIIDQEDADQMLEEIKKQYEQK